VDPAGRPAEKPGRAVLVLLGVLIALGVILRFHGLGARPLWDDEAFGFFVASDTLAHLWDSLSKERHPPLFFLLEWVAVHTLGPSETALRLLPAVFGTALVYVVFVIGRRLIDVRGGLIAAALVATSPILLYHSQEARSSSLLTLALVISTWCIWQHCEQPRLATGVGAVLAGWCAMTAHYLGLAVIPLAGLIVLLRGRKHFLAAATPVVGIALGFAALLPLIIQQRRGVYGGALTFASDQDFSLPIAVVRSLLLLGNGGYPEGIVRIAGYGLFALGLVGLVIGAIKSSEARRAMWYPLLVAGFVLTFLRLGGIVLHWPVRDNYMPVVAPGLYLAVAALITVRVGRISGGWVIAAMLLSMLSGTAALTAGTGHPNPDFRSAGRYVRNQAPDGVLLVRTWGDLACYRYYDPAAGRVGIFGLDPATSPTIESDVVAHPLQTTEAVIRDSRRVCLLGKVSGKPGFEALAAELRKAGFRETGEYHPYDVKVVLWEKRSEDSAGAHARPDRS